jgi:hypothetical protein
MGTPGRGKRLRGGDIMKLIVGLDKGRTLDKAYYGKPGSPPQYFQDLACVSLVRESLEGEMGTLHIHYGDQKYLIGEEATMFSPLNPDTSSNIYFQGNRLSATYFCGIFGPLEKMAQRLNMGNEIDVMLSLAVPLNHRGAIGDKLEATLSGFKVKFEGGRQFNIVKCFVVHQPKPVLFSQRIRWTEGYAHLDPEFENMRRVAILDLGSQTNQRVLYVKGPSKAGKIKWHDLERPANEHGLWEYIKAYGRKKYGEGIPSMWELLHEWNQEPLDIQVEWLNAQVPHIERLLKLPEDFGNVRIFFSGGGCYYHEWLRKRCRVPLSDFEDSARFERFQAEGLYKLAYLWAQTQGE